MNRLRHLGKSKELHVSTASMRLRKMIMYDMAKKLNLHYCYQCKKEIETIEEFTIEHKVPYLHKDNAEELFFDLDNIGFSHFVCNMRAVRRKRCDHGSFNKYNQGCRCTLCKGANQRKVSKWRERRKELKKLKSSGCVETG